MKLQTPSSTRPLQGESACFVGSEYVLHEILEGDAQKMRLVLCGISQKWLLLESKLKLVVKTVGQEL